MLVSSSNSTHTKAKAVAHACFDAPVAEDSIWQVVSNVQGDDYVPYLSRM